ncbi:MAG: glycosyltransferase family 4 protein [Haloarculaceae archaeon]
MGRGIEHGTRPPRRRPGEPGDRRRRPLPPRADRPAPRRRRRARPRRRHPRGEGVLWALRSLCVSLWSLLQLPTREKPDVVHVHSSHGVAFYRASAFVLFAAVVWRCPVVVHVHGSSFDEFVADASAPVAAYQSLVLGAADRVIVLSPYWRDVLAERTDRKRLLVLPNAVDADAYDPAYDADPPRLAFVSNHVERKGVGEFVDAVERLRDRDADLSVAIAGTGPLDHHAEHLAETDPAVTYEGYVSEARKRELLAESSVYVLPTHGEGLPIAMLEGMAGGNAVVATTVGSIPEVIDADRGRLVEPGDVDALVEALAELLAAREHLDAMGRRNRAAVEADYDWAVVIDELTELYRGLANAESGARARQGTAARQP